MTTPPTRPAPRQRRWVLLTGLGAILLVLSLAASSLFFLQPWASCPDSETPAGCPVTGVQAHAQAVALLLVPASFVLTVAAGVRALVRQGARVSPARRTSPRRTASRR